MFVFLVPSFPATLSNAHWIRVESPLTPEYAYPELLCHKHNTLHSTHSPSFCELCEYSPNSCKGSWYVAEILQHEHKHIGQLNAHFPCTWVISANALQIRGITLNTLYTSSICVVSTINTTGYTKIVKVHWNRCHFNVIKPHRHLTMFYIMLCNLFCVY